MKKINTLFWSVVLSFPLQASLPEDDFQTKAHSCTGISFIHKDIHGQAGYGVPFFPSPEENRNHYDDRQGESINSLVMHYTVSNFPRTFDIFTANKPDGRVSAHYAISETDDALGIEGGKIIQVVPENKRAWHAGISQWKGIKNLNPTSIGIENIHKGYVEEQGHRTWFPFDDKQIQSLGQLSQSIVEKYDIHPTQVIGHQDIAFDRKEDPGILFPWDTLYTKFGVGAWLEESERNITTIQGYTPKEMLPNDSTIAFMSTQLHDYGYSLEPTAYETPEFKNALKAFKSHFSQNQYPENYTKNLDHNDMMWAWGLVAKYKI